MNNMPRPTSPNDAELKWLHEEYLRLPAQIGSRPIAKRVLWWTMTAYRQVLTEIVRLHRLLDKTGVQFSPTEEACWVVDDVVDGDEVEVLTPHACYACRWFCDPEIGPEAES